MALDLSGAKKYDPDLMPQMEANIEAQVSGAAPYDPEVARSLLRLYLVFPARAAARCVQRGLLRALLALPEPDMALLFHLVPERMQADEGVAALATLAAHLETGRFKDFWAAAAQPAAAALTAQAASPSFEDACRAFIARQLSGVYRSLPAAQAADALHLDVAALPAWLASGAGAAAAPGWAVEADVVRIPRCDANDPQPQKGAESIPFSKLEGLFKTVKA